jgi:hypothetical protein
VTHAEPIQARTWCNAFRGGLRVKAIGGEGLGARQMLSRVPIRGQVLLPPAPVTYLASAFVNAQTLAPERDQTECLCVP